MSQNHNHPIPLLMQSVALHIVAFVGFKRLLCGCLVNVDNMVMLEAHKECELLKSNNCLTCYLYNA